MGDRIPQGDRKGHPGSGHYTTNWLEQRIRSIVGVTLAVTLAVTLVVTLAVTLKKVLKSVH